MRLVALEASAVESLIRADIEFAASTQLLQFLDAINRGEPDSRWMLVRAQAPSADALGQATIESRAPLR